MTLTFYCTHLCAYTIISQLPPYCTRRPQNRSGVAISGVEARYEPVQHPEDAHAPPQIERLWRSRDNRKGRHAIRIDTEALPHETGLKAPPLTQSVSAVAKIFLWMVTYVPYWDVSYLVAMSFTIGSAIFIVNGFFVWLPHDRIYDPVV
ncbi:hypothetical protein N7471_004074 [Penicillium samsonianum]|uniref:uncharacterized protein n=1 Tax=Penicillium samsonianum TaxID=1882272 RepID=UPI0025489C64|nr:uncharacterized protein N7471_004074 [Penicillium samsonianum]KAJ6137588.1 hypothetical protein N7471_004074 [Penicillium samsonianum]